MRDAFRIEGGVGIGPAGKFEVASTYVDNVRTVWGPGYLVDFLAVVVIVRGEALRGEFAGAVGGGDPHVALALFVFDPGEAAGLLAGDEV